VVPPKIVRGRSGIEQKDEILAALVADVLEGWGDVDTSAIQVEAKNGEGHLFTYKVSAEGAVPPAVALHCWNEDAALDPILQPRTAAAAQLFAAVGLAPSRLAQGGDWFIETWEGLGEPELTLDCLDELGKLVARIHRIPTAWFDVWREKLRERRPAMRQVPEGSHVWWWSAREKLLGSVKAECLQVWLSARFFDPVSPTARRLVTAHADLHAGNMLQTPMGIRVIDFEYTCVTHAVQDLSFIVSETCSGDLAMKRTFIQAYLHEAGEPCGEEEVESLLFDCEVGVLGSHFGPLDLETAEEEPEGWLEKVELYKMYVPDARSSPSLRQQVIEQGLVQYVKHHNRFCKADSPVVLCSLCDALNVRLAVNPDNTVSPVALRSLVLGATEDGAIILVQRNDAARRLTLRVEHSEQEMPLGGLHGRSEPSMHMPGSQSEGLPDAGPGQAGGVSPATFRLLSESNPCLALVLTGERRCIEATVVAPVVLGPIEQATALVFDGIMLRNLEDPRQALYIGDPCEELDRRQNAQLYSAAERGDVLAVEELVARGADVNWRRDDDSLGHVAAREGHSAVLEVLLAHGFDVNTQAASFGGSALIEAATHGHTDCVQRLLAAEGVDLCLTEDDKTALDWARDPSPHAELTEQHREIAALLEAAERVSVLQVCNVARACLPCMQSIPARDLR